MDDLKQLVSFHTDNCSSFYGQFYVDTGLDTELSINLSVPLSNVSFRVCAYTGAGRGPWTPSQTLSLVSPGEWQIVHVNLADNNDHRQCFGLKPRGEKNLEFSFFFPPTEMEEFRGESLFSGFQTLL